MQCCCTRFPKLYFPVYIPNRYHWRSNSPSSPRQTEQLLWSSFSRIDFDRTRYNYMYIYVLHYLDNVLLHVFLRVQDMDYGNNYICLATVVVAEQILLLEGVIPQSYDRGILSWNSIGAAPDIPTKDSIVPLEACFGVFGWFNEYSRNRESLNYTQKQTVVRRYCN